MDHFLLVLDQFRFITSLLVAERLFLINAAPRRKNFALRAALGYGICILAAMLYIPIQARLLRIENIMVMGLLAELYWAFMMALTCAAQWCCFDIGPCNMFFRCIAGSALENVSTTVLRSLIVHLWFPRLPETHTVLYILLALALYTAFYYAAYQILCRPLQRGADVGVPEDRRTFWFCFLLYIGLSLLINVSKGISEWVLMMIDTEQYRDLYQMMQYYSVMVMLLVSSVILVILYYVYEIGALRTERRMLGQLMAEKAAQYERSRDSIEAINRKCHDLKHQLLALKFASDSERKAMIDETEKAVMFYDAVVKTGNEVLDTLLTEKSTVCAFHRIHLSCTVNTGSVDRFGVVDLYTMLGNAIDNAIECVQQFADDDKKTISLTIREKGQMLLICMENYYEKEIQMLGDYPLTSKADAQNHGIGIKSIAMIAKRYGGSTQVSTEGQIFRLQILLPIPK